MTLAVSYGVIAATLLVGDTVRNRVLPAALPRRDSLARAAATDAVLAVELCATGFEMGAVIEHHGMAAWAAGLFCLVFYQVLRWRELSAPCPYSHLLELLAGRRGAAETAARCGVLLAAGLASYRIARAVWALELAETHVGRPGLVDACAVPWTDVPVATAAAAEFAGTFALAVGPPLAAENPTLANNDPAFTAAAVAAMVVAAVWAAVDVSGGMFNPMLATVLLGGCSGHEWWEHVAIYWVGSTAGAVAAARAYPAIKRAVYGGEETDVKKSS